MMTKSFTNITSALLALVVICSILLECCNANEKQKKFVPPGMNPDMFPEPDYDPQAPECTPLREPCGFYSFSLHGKTPFKWIKSWCRCGDNQECVYDRTDMKMRLYRQMCVSREQLQEREEEFERKYIYL
uniref:Uncharacterized protein n=1 Tax=Panagrolaimus sp. JU765 TaxID=591449 RepID=A0AC34QAR0_9BILA